ncbi:sporulation protein [Soonwooa sp.]|uniref:sporulation protein n=1 Tax=Soonwooa sp. TaxID=1938592 RepID=UPI002610A635|nr:sporulation protein [Soonwooa sp.]
MGLFGTIKNKLGIGGVSIEFTVPSQVEKSSRFVDGKITLTTKSDQEIVKIQAILEEEFTTGVGENKKKKKFELGKWSSFEAFTIRTGEVKEILFRINFEESKSDMDKLSEKGGLMGGLGKGLKFMNQEKSAFFVVVDVDVKSAVLDPSEKKEIKLI